MKAIQKKALAAALLMMATAIAVYAQGPLQKRVYYSINVPYKVQMGGYLLPPGRYLLYQVMRDDRNLYALYRGEREDSPIAMIRTVPIEYLDIPDETEILIEMDESDREAYPIIKGWTIPGESGWEIISVVANDKKFLTRVR